MRFCLNCQIEYGDDKKFCKTCGAELISRDPKKNCPDCLIEYEPDKKFCKKCGRRLDPGPLLSILNEKERPEQPSAKAKTPAGAAASVQSPPPPVRDSAKVNKDLIRPATASPASPVKGRLWYEAIVPIMMGLFSLGLAVVAINLFSVDGISDFNDDEVRSAWAMIAGGLVSAVTGIFLWRRRPSARVFITASVVVLALVPLLLVLFFLLQEY